MEKYLERIILYALACGVGLQRLSIFLGNTCIALTIVFFIVWCYKNKQYLREFIVTRISFDLHRYYLIFLLCFVPSVIFSGTFYYSIKQLLEMFVFRILPFVIVVLVAQRKKILEHMLLGIFIIYSVDCFVALYQSLYLGIYNAEGFDKQYLNLAGMLACLLPLVAVVALDKYFTGYLKQAACIVLPIYLACDLVASKSRCLWVITIFLLFILVLHYWSYIWKSKTVIAVFLVTVALMACFFLQSDKNLNRLESFGDWHSNGSNIDRLYMWRSCSKIILDYPLNGVGLGNFNRCYNQRYEMAAIPDKGFSHPHNSYLMLGAEAGIPGFVAIISITVAFLVKLVKMYKFENNIYAYVLFLMWLNFSVFGMIEPIIDSAVHMKSMSLLTGMLIMLNHLEQQTTDNCKRLRK